MGVLNVLDLTSMIPNDVARQLRRCELRPAATSILAIKSKIDSVNAKLAKPPP